MPSARLEAMLATFPAVRYELRSDAELLARFLDQRDEQAFETLLLRHRGGVRAACRGWLRAEADIDDATQATFLVLVQRAGSIRNREALGPWLHRVAVNVSRRLRRRCQAAVPLPENLPARLAPPKDDLQDLLYSEIARLPEKYRLPVLLCYSSGLTTAEAAHRLGWPKGTVLTRLAWARLRLQKILRQRGVAPSALVALCVIASPAVSGPWLRTTVRAAVTLGAHDPSALAPLPERVVALFQGVVRTMKFERLKFLALFVLLAAGLIGVGLRPWVAAADGPKKGEDVDSRGPNPSVVALQSKEPVKPDEGRPATTGRRREAVIRLPLGTFVKEVEFPPYGAAKITWNYEEERVTGVIEASVLGFEVEVATEAEYSLSSNGTIYGLLTSVRINHVRLPQGEEYAALKPYLAFWSAAEPLLNEITTDLPFSYRFRIQGDRLVLSDFRMLLAGPNPLGKVGGLTMSDALLGPLSYFQALAVAFEGTYVSPEAREKPAPERRLLFRKPTGLSEPRKSK